MQGKTQAVAGMSTRSGTSDTYEETLRLFDSGMLYKEIAKNRDLTTQTILRHLQKLTIDGEAIDVSDETNDSLLDRVRSVSTDWSFGDPEKPLIEALEGECTYNELRLHLIPILAERS